MILAVDPGLDNFGWALVTPRTGAVRELGLVRTKRGEDEGAQRARTIRAREIADALLDVYARAPVTAIVGEALSFGFGNKVAGVASLCLAWGVIAALAATWSVPHLDVAPKLWQTAVLGRAGKVSYDQVELALAGYLAHQHERPRAQLAAIPPSKRNHALDAVGIGVYAALRGDIA